MKLSDDVKLQALQAMEAAHHFKAGKLTARLRICGLSFKDMAEFWRILRRERFLAIADAERFNAESAETFVENADTLIAELAGVAAEDLVVINVSAVEHIVSIAASLGTGADARAIWVMADAAGEARLLPLEKDRSWYRGADGKLRLRIRRGAALEPDASWS